MENPFIVVAAKKAGIQLAYCVVSYTFCASMAFIFRNLWYSRFLFKSCQLGGLTEILVDTVFRDEKTYYASDAGTRLLEQITVFVMVNNFIVHPLICFSSAYIDELVLQMHCTLFDINLLHPRPNMHSIARRRWKKEPSFRLFSYRAYLNWTSIDDQVAAAQSSFHHRNAQFYLLRSLLFILLDLFLRVFRFDDTSNINPYAPVAMRQTVLYLVYCITSCTFCAIISVELRGSSRFRNILMFLQLGGLSFILWRIFFVDGKSHFAADAATCLLEQISVFLMVNNFVVHPLLCFMSVFIDQLVLMAHAWANNKHPTPGDEMTEAISQVRNEPMMHLFSYRGYLWWYRLGHHVDDELTVKIVWSVDRWIGIIRSWIEVQGETSDFTLEWLAFFSVLLIAHLMTMEIWLVIVVLEFYCIFFEEYYLPGSQYIWLLLVVVCKQLLLLLLKLK